MYAAPLWDEVELYIRNLKERKIKVNSRLAKALCQVQHESEGIKSLVEDLSHTQSVLKEVLGNEHQNTTSMQVETHGSSTKDKGKT